MRRIKLIAHAMLLSMLASYPAFAGELTPFLADGRIGARLRGLHYPSTLSKDLTSGLTNRILIRVTLLSDTRGTTQRAVDITVKYDLWDETFRLTAAMDQLVLLDRQYSNLTEVMAFLNDARLPALFETTGMSGTQALTLRADVLLNPIDKERMDKIRKWVRDNSVHVPANPTVPDGSVPPGASLSNDLFNRIFEQYASGAKVAAAWHETVVSHPFRLDTVTHDRP